MAEQYIEGAQQLQQEENEEMDIFSILRICVAVFLRNWKWFLLSVVACLLFALLFVKKQPRVYSRQSTLLIENNDNNGKYANNSALNALKQLNGVQVTDNLKNEIFILQSRRLMEMVVERMNLDVDYVMMKGLQPVTLFKHNPIKVEFLSLYFEDISFEVELLPSKQLKVSDMQIDDSDVDFKQVVSYGQSFNSPAGNIRISQAEFDPEFVGKIIHVTRIKKEDAITKFNKAVTASEVNKEASLISLTCKDNNKDRAEAILTVLMDLYKRDIVESKNSVAANTAKFVDQRIDLIGSELNDVENKLAKFKDLFATKCAFPTGIE